LSQTLPPLVPGRAAEILARDLLGLRRGASRAFLVVLLLQWVGAMLIAWLVTPYTWQGTEASVHQHVILAVVGGAVLNSIPLGLLVSRPDAAFTRHAVAVAQMLWAALLVHLTGGRIETHFHIFVSLVLVALFRDPWVLVTSTVVVAADHLLRGVFAPQSVYGVIGPSALRFLEHAGWVVCECIVLTLGLRSSRVNMHQNAEREARLEQMNHEIEAQVQERTRQLEAGHERFRALVENTNAVPWEMDLRTRTFSYIAPQAAHVLGVDLAQANGSRGIWRHIHRDDRVAFLSALETAASRRDQASDGFDYRMLDGGGNVRHVRSMFSRVTGDEWLLRGLTIDVSRQKVMELELRQAQKLESVGRLAAGVAHEINTPVQFVSDSVRYVKEAVADLSGLLEAYRELTTAALAGADAKALAGRARAAEDDADADYFLENVPVALERSLDGLGRVATIVRSMKEFAHPDEREMTCVDLNHAIQSTLIVATNEYKYVADVETDLGDIPKVTCHGGDVNQAILNVVVNAAHAIGDVVGSSGARGRITVRTRQAGSHVVIAIADTGGGIPEAVRGRVFDPFFTTKEVGRGTGQGLAIVRSIVQEKHGGRVDFETEAGKGTTFFLRLPIEGRGAAKVEVAA
jgi:signal transduction histidine kinase